MHEEKILPSSLTHQAASPVTSAVNATFPLAVQDTNAAAPAAAVHNSGIRRYFYDYNGVS